MATPQEFAQQYGPVAASVGQRLGVDPTVLLGQWGLETGWGKSVIPGTHNLGNIKDFSGGGVTAKDNMTGSMDGYQKFDSPQAFGDHFSGLIERKYPNAIGAGSDATAFANALKAGGYAEDPGYVGKIAGATGAVRKTPGIMDKLASAIFPSAQAGELPSPKLQGDPVWQMLNSGSKSGEVAPVSEKLASDPVWQALNGSAAPDDPTKRQTSTYKGDTVTAIYDEPQQPTATTPATEDAQNPGIIAQFGRQLGLSARALGHGAADAVGLFGDPLNAGINSLAGTNLPPVGRTLRSAVDSVTPAPVGNFEQGVQTAASAVANPLNLLGGGAIAAAKTLPQLAMRSGMLGAMAGGISPSQDPNGDSVGQLAVRAGEGFLAGATLGPLAKYAGDAIGAGVNKLTSAAKTAVSPQVAEATANNAILNLTNQGVNVSQVPPEILASIKQQVQDAALKGQKLDPAALLRLQDFRASGVTPTLGQVTRDPMQFAQERNLRGIDLGGGQNPLATRLNDQPNQLTQQINSFGANEAQDAYPAGNALMARLQAADAPVKAGVDAAYNGARDSAGRYANLDVPAFSTAANDALDSAMLGRFLPSNVRGLLNDVSSGKIPLNVNTAVQVDSVMSQAQRAAQASGDPAAVKAIGVVRDALNSAPIDSSLGAEAKAAFDAARTAAAKRFKTIENTPALDAALNDAKPDNFINKFVINGDVKSLQSLRAVVKDDPQAVGIIRSQIADYLKTKAFGVNAAGDGNIGQASFNRALDSMGRDKLLTFFSPAEVDQMFTLGRVSAYINSQPAGAAANNSNTSGALMNLLISVKKGLLKLPGVESVDAGVSKFKQTKGVQNALEARVAPTATKVKGNNELLRLTAPTADTFVEQRQ